MKYLKLILIIFLAIIAVWLINYLVPVKEEKNIPIIMGPHLVLPITEFDFGETKQSGPIVKRSFEIINDGTEEARIEKVLTSCSCTSAKIDKETIKAGERAILTVEFDPNYHFESYDQIMRTATIFSNAVNSPRPEIKIYALVEYDLGVDKTKYGKDED